MLAELSMVTCTFCLSSNDFLSTDTLFAKQIYSNHTLAWIFPQICCIFSEYYFLRTALQGYF